MCRPRSAAARCTANSSTNGRAVGAGAMETTHFRNLYRLGQRRRGSREKGRYLGTAGDNGRMLCRPTSWRLRAALRQDVTAAFTTPQRSHRRLQPARGSSSSRPSGQKGRPWCKRLHYWIPSRQCGRSAPDHAGETRRATEFRLACAPRGSNRLPRLPL